MKNIEKNIVLFLAILFVCGCTEIPDEGSIAPDVKYKNRKQLAISGIKQTIGLFEASTSTLPLRFEIAKVSEAKGQDVSALNEEVSVVRYKKPLTGNESSEELALKTEKVMLSALSINEYTGQIEVQEGNNIPSGEYRFDVQVSNTSGSVLLEDAIVIEFEEYKVASYSKGMAKEPEIKRIGDEPHQIIFKGYLDGKQLPGNRIDFTKDRSEGFKGTFVNDTPEGEIWSVNFPVTYSTTYCTWKIIENDGETEKISYVSEDFRFVLGRPGNYEIKLYK